MNELTIIKQTPALIALLCSSCIAISLALARFFDPKANLILLKHFINSRLQQRVAIECLWTGCLVPFHIVLSLFSLGLRTGFVGGPAHAPFAILEVLCWLLTVLLTAYAVSIISLAFLTAFTVDKDVWYRDIAASPSPYPLQHIVAFLSQPRTSPSGLDTRNSVHHCMPGCTCREKQPPSSPPPALPSIGPRLGARMLDRPHIESSVPVRVPTAMERYNSIVIGFDV
ncbi:hypothetical protein EW146_g926 [Bondarzewia mesenterica]|uniref:Uncharacterized protein n=1 Tax=Bondarzewia mesenterica TaxID=1095465 RepID=A0A4S4M5V3_9AGAM|nr:hypothetical protein EW146_g926 [Bondarzewia mesenterica]